MLNSTATHFFCADKTQFESLNVAPAGEEKEISMTNNDVVKSAGQGTVRLVVNNKNQE